MISYETAVQSLYALGHELHSGTPRKFELAHMRTLCAALGNPQTRFASVLIAGTNGKGSTASTLASILREAGHRTGLYTSPHLVRVNERIAINGEAISDASFAGSYERVTEVAQQLVSTGALPHLPSFFETLTAMAFDFFSAQNVEIAVLEVGMGGRLDATNVVEPVLSVITDIDLDHQKFLGDTIGAIAAEKAGILRRDVPAITLPQHPEANDVLGRKMIEVGARAVSATRNMASVSPASSELVSSTATETRFRLQVLGEETEIVSPLIGRHQLRNLALAITAAEELNSIGFKTTADAISRGVRSTRWPGRFQRVPASDARPEIIIDVAHNPAGAWALRSALSEQGTERPVVMVFGAMHDKAIEEMAQILWPVAEKLVLTRTSQSPRAASTEELTALAAKLGCDAVAADTVAEALSVAEREANLRKGIIVIAGSIYIAGEAMQVLQAAH